MYSPTPAARTRPSSVTISSYLLYGAAALMLLGAVLALSNLGTMARVAREVYAGSSASGAQAGVVGIVAVTAGLSIIVAAGFVILAIFNNRGKNPSRIVTWVVAGLALCCGGFTLLGNAAGGMNGSGSGAEAADAAELERRLNAELPGWYEPLSTTLSVLVLLALVAVLVLLALPASNEFFRKPAHGWEPPVPGQPPYPGQAPYPGQPNPGQAPYPGQPNPGQSPYPGQTPYPGQQGENPPSSPNTPPTV